MYLSPHHMGSHTSSLNKWFEVVVLYFSMIALCFNKWIKMLTFEMFFFSVYEHRVDIHKWIKMLSFETFFFQFTSTEFSEWIKMLTFKMFFFQFTSTVCT